MYWLNMVSLSIFGHNEFALRLPTALFALAGCIMAYHAARRLFNNTTIALHAAIILATAPLFAIHSRMAVLDLPLSVALGTALLSMLLYLEQGKKRDIWLAWGGITAAFLIKGLIALLLPVLIMGIWAWRMGIFWQTLRRLLHWPAMLVFAVVVTPWHVAVEHYNTGFLHHYFIAEHFGRFNGEVTNRNKPFWFFVPVLLGGFLPYSVLLPKLTAVLWQQRGVPLFLAIWAAVVFVFFSLSGSKVATYILPMLMPLSILSAWVLAQANTGTWLHKVQLKIIPIAATMASLLLLADALAAQHDSRSIKDLAQHIPPHARVANYGQWYNDLPLYTQRTVTMCLGGGQEMRFGLARPNAPRVLSEAECAAFLREPTATYVVTPLHFYETSPLLQQLRPIAQTKRNILLYNGQ
jgi:4-amino-4-deoxy-L-arabinose transferase-like glycosyltransferase